MTYFIVTMIIIVTFHFIYDGIILPSIRLHFRNELFALRDSLRNMQINGLITKEDDVAFSIVEGSINNSLNNLHNLNFSMLIRTPINHERATLRLEAVNNAKNSEITTIFNSVSGIMLRVFVANMGGWLIYILPIAILINYLNKVRLSVKDLLLLPSNLFVNQRPC